VNYKVYIPLIITQNSKILINKLPVEDFPKGYPRFSVLMAAHDSFQIFRRFFLLRTRLLLISQDKLVCLEKKLERIDREEASSFFLASCRRDRNIERESVIKEMHSALATYGEFTLFHIQT
jgi:hypothetical protein